MTLPEIPVQYVFNGIGGNSLFSLVLLWVAWEAVFSLRISNGLNLWSRLQCPSTNLKKITKTETHFTFKHTSVTSSCMN